jgi:imidazole glycerol-phosphate synthase subunit HisF
MRCVMLKKRLIGVVIVKNGLAIQSFGYNRYFPLGKPECLVENLDRWGVDEILVLSIDRYKNKLGPDFLLLEKLANLGLETPLIYGGGISSVEEGVKAVQLGADRVCVDSLLQDNIEIVIELSEQIGQQAIVGVIPVSEVNGVIKRLDYRTKSSLPLTDKNLEESGRAISELLLVDWINEGSKNGFNMQIIKKFCNTSIPLIPFGGLSEDDKINDLLEHKGISAIAIGNFLNYKEHSVQSYKKEHSKSYIRKPHYKEKYTLLSHE